MDELGSDPRLSCDSYITFYCIYFLSNVTKYQLIYFSHRQSLSLHFNHTKSRRHRQKDKQVKNKRKEEECLPNGQKEKKQTTGAWANKNNSHDCKSAVLHFIRRNELCVASCPLQTTGVFSHGSAKDYCTANSGQAGVQAVRRLGASFERTKCPELRLENIVNRLPVESSSPTARWKLD